MAVSHPREQPGTAEGRDQTPARARLALLTSFLRTEAGGALVLLAAAVAALVWANSPVGDSYDAF